LASSPEYRLDIARRIVAGKITNQRVLLLRRQRSSGVRLDVSVERLAAARLRAATATSVNELMGVEGAATREYFHAFGSLLPSSFEFSIRRRRPPPDPINSMLSFGYTLLVQELISAVESSGLDSSEGVLHSRKVGRPSLALDLVEEFRSVIVDSLVLRLVNTGAITPESFDYPEVSTNVCRLSNDARRTFLREYERRQLTLTTHPGTGRRVSYRVAAGLQARQLAAELQGGKTTFEPMVWK
jgi:CRISPR-associated protein Cas1